MERERKRRRRETSARCLALRDDGRRQEGGERRDYGDGDQGKMYAHKIIQNDLNGGDGSASLPRAKVFKFNGINFDTRRIARVAADEVKT